jgi:hypothetical protein
LRYVVADGDHAGRVLRGQGDGYVSSLVPWLIVLGAIGLGGLVLLSARALRDPRLGGEWRRRRIAVLWVGSTVLVLGGYVLQESLEVLVGDAHQSLLPLAFGGGGWIAVPLSVAVGLLWALVARGAGEVLALVCRRVERAARPRLERGVFPGRAVGFSKAHACPLARRLAGRAPPFAQSLA